MRYNEIKLVESSGVFNRKPGQTFINPNTNEVLSFQEASIYPKDKERFDSFEERDLVVKEVESNLGVNIQWTNAPSRSLLSFGVAVLKNQKTDQLTVFGRFFQKRNMSGIPATWKNDQMGSLKLQTAVSKKAVAGLMPQDIIGIEEKRYRGLAQILSQIKINLKDKPEVLNGFEMLANGKMPVIFEGQVENHEALRDYGGEVLQPIALMSGVILGQAEEAREQLIEGASWKDCEVFWPAGKNHNLVDSVFIGPNGQEVGISSKGGSGADASVKNIFDAIQKARKSNSDLITKYEKTVKIVEDFHTTSAKVGPLKVAVYLGLISEESVRFINNMTKQGVTLDDLRSLKDNELQQIFKSHSAKYNHQNYNPYFHMLANVAKMVAEDLNTDKEFGTGMLQFMNQASIIQIYTKSKTSGNDVYITDFNAVYPPNFDGRIFLNGGKTYTSTKIIGKMSFTYKPN